MPKIYSHIVNPTTQLALWHIVEDENFFLQKVPLKANISHPHKRLQHLAGRYLLQEIVPNFPIELIEIADTRKPFLANESHHFSISHCGNFAAAIVSTTHRVGIDIEIFSKRILKVLHKFLSEKEMSLIEEKNKIFNNQYLIVNAQMPAAHCQLPTVFWSAKEAVYKWFGVGEIDFKEHMPIVKIAGENKGKLEMDFGRNAVPERLSIDYEMFEMFCLAWLVTG